MPSALHPVLAPFLLIIAPTLLNPPVARAESRPFGPPAFEEARKTGRAVALLIAPRICSRCRALEAPALRDPSVAGVLQDRFVPVALDPDERPDVTRALFDALLLLPEPRLPQDPGLPTVIVTTPDLRVLDGTGLAREGRPLGPALLPFLVRLADEWDHDRGAAEARGGLVIAALREAQAAASPLLALSASLLDRPRAGLSEAYDRRHGGFGLPPRRVPHGALLFLLEEYERTGDKAALAMATDTLDAIVTGGLRDPHGGFFREAAAEDWSAPEPEKTLADNSLLLSALVRAHAATGKATYAAEAQGLANWIRSDLADPAGGFAHVVASGDERDPRVFAYANGLALSGLARSAEGLERKGDLEAAVAAAGRILSRLGPARSLARWAEGDTAHGPSFLEDYVFLALGLLDLHAAQGAERWRDGARDLLDEAASRFSGPAGGFFESAEDGALRPVRRRDAYDGRLPSPNAAMVVALRRLARVTGETRYLELSRRTALAFAGDLARTPRGLETLAAAVGESVGPSPPLAVAPEAPSRATRGAVSFEMAVVPERVRAGDSVEAILRLRVGPGAFVIAHRPAASARETRDLAPLALAFPGVPFRMGTPRYPDGVALTPPGSFAPVLAHRGVVTVATSVNVAPDATAGERRLRLSVVFQVCDLRRCEAPDRVLLEAPIVIERP